MSTTATIPAREFNRDPITNRIILTAADIPADSDLTLEQWQGIVEAMYTLTTDELKTLIAYCTTTAKL